MRAKQMANLPGYVLTDADLFILYNESNRTCGLIANAIFDYLNRMNG